MTIPELRLLFSQYLEGTITPEQYELLSEVAATCDRNTWYEVVEPFIQSINSEGAFNKQEWDPMISAILKTDSLTAAATAPVHRVHFLKTAWFRYAAAVICIVATGAYLWFMNAPKQTLTDSHKQLPADAKPGKEGAILTLADGSVLVLDSLREGVIAEQNGSKILLEDGRMVYHAERASSSDIVYNTMSTPKGRQFQFTLPDGTVVWLNAASSIRYPTVFAGKNRKVNVNGEVYFDVSKNPDKPFIVETDKVSIEVLGTEFNINNYDNETYSQITLVNGLVKLVSKEDGLTPSYKLLYPGKQATILRKQKDADPIRITDAANIDQVIAWKEGLFNFNKVDLFNLMRQLERWYNIEVEYRGEVENIRFRGKMYRSVNLSDVLKELRKMDLSIEQEGNKLIVKSIK